MFMTAKKVISFLIASSAILVASLIITFTVILPTQTVSQPKSLTAYAFCFNVENDSSIYKISDTRLKLSQNVEFHPTQSTDWSNEFLTFKGSTVAEGVEYRNTQMSEYVCAIPFTIFNNYDRKIEFKLNVEVSGNEELANNIEYKIYDFCDKQYKTVSEINCVSGEGRYSYNNSPYNELLAYQTSHYCLVAIVSGQNEIDFSNSLAFVNINISVSIV